MKQTEKKTALELANEKIFTKETLDELDSLTEDFCETYAPPKGVVSRMLGDVRAILKSHVELIDEELARR